MSKDNTPRDGLPNMTNTQAIAAIIKCGKRMDARSFGAANDGNISCLVDNGTIWITASGVSKGHLTPDDVLSISSNPSKDSKISSEYKMHLAIYENNPQALAIVHAHPVTATAFAVCGKPLELPILPEVIMNLGGVIPVVPYARPGTQELADNLIPYAQKYRAVLLQNHGVVCWGRDIWQAYAHMETVEHYARILLACQAIGNPHLLTKEQIEELLPH